MRPILITVLLTAMLGLSACASPLTPENWFGGSRSEPAPADPRAASNPLIPETPRRGFFRNAFRAPLYAGQPIDQVTSVVVEPVPGGAIIRATGISAYDGVYDVQLTPNNIDDEAVDGVLTYRFEGVLPEDLTRRTSQQLRTVTAGHRVSDIQLAETRVIRVEAARNAQVTSRR